MISYFAILFLCLITNIVESDGARILGIVPIPSYSHQIPYRAIWKELSHKGHQITLLTTNPMNDPTLVNISEIDLSFAYDLYNNKHNINNIILTYNTNYLKSTKLYTEMMDEILDEELKLPQVKNLLDDKSLQFDLVMVEFFFPVMFAFSERFNCPMVGLTPVDALSFGHEVLGNPIHPAVFPDISQPFGTSLSFHERFFSTAYFLAIKLFKILVVYPNGDQLVERHFGPGYRKVKDMERDVSLVFTNTNPALDDGRPLARKVIQIGGGIHINPPKKLPEDIAAFLNNSNRGAIYLSLGSNVKCSSLGIHKIRSLVKAFADLPYKVLWKCDKQFNSIDQKMMVRTWLPQQDILRHTNIKLFITQGGYQSIEEAIANELPIIGIPFFFDQHYNVIRMVEKGCGLILDYENLNENALKNAILEVMKNDKYYENIRKLKILVYDQPMTGLEKAIWWTEYVLRHRGTKHLKNPLVDCEFYKYFLLDIILFICIIIIMFIFFILKLKWLLTYHKKNKND